MYSSACCRSFLFSFAKALFCFNKSSFSLHMSFMFRSCSSLNDLTIFRPLTFSCVSLSCSAFMLSISLICSTSFSFSSLSISACLTALSFSSCNSVKLFISLFFFSKSSRRQSRSLLTCLNSMSLLSSLWFSFFKISSSLSTFSLSVLRVLKSFLSRFSFCRS